jgi:hypothetical protein
MPERINISDVRQIFVVPMLTVANVMKLLVCSRSSAYEHMNRALGRTERPGRLLRVPLDVFESYIAKTLGLTAPVVIPPAPIERRSAGLSEAPATLPRSTSSGAPAIRVAQPPRRRG